MIADYLCNNETIKEDEKDIYIYGYEIMLSNVVNFLIILSLSLFLNQLIDGFLFYITFIITRQYCGGYHANTYLKCNLIFGFLCLLTLFFSNILYPYISFISLMILFFIYIGCIFEYAPIDNEYKRLSEKDKKKYRKISIWISVLWLVVDILLFFTAKEYAITLTITLVIIAMLMVIEINRRKEYI
jgi:accessory gene regulator B